MPYELVNFVENQTNLKVQSRVGGDDTLLKRFIASGFPVIVEKGFEGASFDGWMGHYELVTGYDDASGQFTTQDSYMGPNLKVPYNQMESWWRAFNFTYMDNGKNV
jgi:hypothetical protein